MDLKSAGGALKTAKQGVQQAVPANENPHIPVWEEALMILVAIGIDLIQFGVNFIPILGQVISMMITFVAGLLYYIWFKTHGISFTSWKKMLGAGTVGLSSFIPVWNDMPEWTIGVIWTILSNGSSVMRTLKSGIGGKILDAAAD